MTIEIMSFEDHSRCQPLDLAMQSADLCQFPDRTQRW
jgi:hypothetical protein